MSDATEDQAILGLYQRGLSAPEISAELDVPSYRVRLSLKEQGVSLHGGKRNEKYLHLAQVKEHLARGLSIAETAALIGKPYNTVLRWCRQESLTDSKDAQRLSAVERYRAGEDAKAIAVALEVGHATILRWLHAAGIDVSVPGRRPGYAPKKLRLFGRVRELHEQGLTVYQIAQEVDVHVDTIGIWLREEGLQPIYAVARTGEAKGTDPRTSPKREEGLRLYREGYTASMIGKVLEVPTGTVDSWVSRAGLHGKGGKAVQRERKALRAVELHDQGQGTDAISAALKTSYYLVQNWLFDAGRITERTSFGECAAEDCRELVYSPDHKYHDDACRQKNMKRRQADPANLVTFTCLNCKKEFTLPRSYTSVGKYCSNECAAKHTRVKQHIVVDDAIVLDSGYEALFWGLCSLWKLPVERGDRAKAVAVGLNGWYCPDFYMPGLNIWVEVKGFEDEDDRLRYDTWRMSGRKLAVLRREELDVLRTRANANEVWEQLRAWAH